MTQTTRTATVGFVGLGTMGGPMVANVAKGDFDLHLYDTDVERAGALASELAATAVDHPEGLAACDVVVLMLPTSDIVRAVLVGESGDLRIPLRKGAVVVDMSSSDPLQTVSTGKVLAAHGVEMVDAPVSGARERAIAGTLSIMLGADSDDAVEQAMPVIDMMSQNVYRTGRLGSGHAMKALNNYVAAAAFTAASEALVSGEQFGLDPQVMVDVFNASTGQSFVTSHVLGPHIVEKKYASGFSLPLMTKDVRIARSLQQAVGTTAPVCDAVADMLGDALEALGNVDHTRAYTFWESRSTDVSVAED